MPESKYLISGQTVRVMAVYFYVEMRLEQMYNFVGTIEELVNAVALIGGLHGNFKKRLEIIQSMHC